MPLIDTIDSERVEKGEQAGTQGSQSGDKKGHFHEFGWLSSLHCCGLWHKCILRPHSLPLSFTKLRLTISQMNDRPTDWLTDYAKRPFASHTHGWSKRDRVFIGTSGGVRATTSIKRPPCTHIKTLAFIYPYTDTDISSQQNRHIPTHPWTDSAIHSPKQTISNGPKMMSICILPLNLGLTLNLHRDPISENRIRNTLSRNFSPGIEPGDNESWINGSIYAS